MKVDSINLAVVTWNVGGCPGGQPLGINHLLQCARTADVIVVGLQEVSFSFASWKKQLSQYLGNAWVYMGGEKIAGLRLRVFCRLRDGKPVVGIASPGLKIKFGLLNRACSKGAVGVEIQFSTSCRVLVLAAHLAAHQHKVDERNKHFHSILQRLGGQQNHSDTTPLLDRYDHVFFLGDLNYRIDPPESVRDQSLKWVQENIATENWKALLGSDQLMNEIVKGNVFSNFQEADISFPPTFKIDTTTGKYTTKRVPSYCDRILWHSLPGQTAFVENIRYESLPSCRYSDHIPVTAQFKLTII